MTQYALQNVVGTAFLLIQFSAIGSVVFCFTKRWFLFEQMTTTLALVVPMLAAYTIMFVKFVFARPYKRKTHERRLAVPFVGLAVTFPTVYGVWILGVIWFQARGDVFQTFEQFKGMLALAETLFGAYMAMTFGALYAKEVESRKTVDSVQRVKELPHDHAGT